MRHQSELSGRIGQIAKSVAIIYNTVGELVKESCNEDTKFQPLVTEFLKIKADSNLDRVEAEGVEASAARPVKVPLAKGAAKKKSKSGAAQGGRSLVKVEN